MKTGVLQEILAWSEERPAWQRDALRRVFTVGALDASDMDELVSLCKAAHGLATAASPNVLTKANLAIKEDDARPVSLASVTHHRGVNALGVGRRFSIFATLNALISVDACSQA